MEIIKDIVVLLSACLTPAVALIGIFIGVKYYKLAFRKRKDDLFDRRYKFLKDFERLWKNAGSEHSYLESQSL